MHLRISAVNSVLSMLVLNHYQGHFNRKCTQIDADVAMRGSDLVSCQSACSNHHSNRFQILIRLFLMVALRHKMFQSLF